MKDSDLNPYTAQLVGVSNEIDKLNTQLERLSKAIRDYESLSKERVSANLRQCELALKVAVARDQERWDVGELLNEVIVRRFKTPLPVWNVVLEALNARATHHEQKISLAKEDRDKATSWVDWFDNFDMSGARKESSAVSAQIAEASSKRAELEHRWETVNNALQPHVAVIKDVESKLKEAQSKKESADKFIERLEETDNSYQRALIHKECEEALGQGNPRHVLSEIKRLERDLAKAVARARDIARDASLVIGRVVLDGNNLCFDNTGEVPRFLGLAVVQRIVADLGAKYEMIVVFDDSIRESLHMADPAIHAHVGGKAKTHIVPSKMKADETVLDIAGDRPDGYALSNDLYSEFPEKRVVAECRLLRHEIVDGRVFVRALNYEGRWASRTRQA